MKFNTKLALFALTSGIIALSTWSCFSQWLGDALGDNIWLRVVD